MATPKTLDAAVVSLLVEIESMLVRNGRVAEVTEYRRGFQEALTGLKNSVEMIDVVDALKALGWQPPRMSWGQPSAASVYRPLATPSE